MDIVFKSRWDFRTERGRLSDVNEAFANKPSEALEAVASTLCKIVFGASADSILSPESLMSSIQAIEIQSQICRDVLKGVVFPEYEYLSKKEKEKYETSINGLYGRDTPENAFSRYGGYEGILTLILLFRDSEKNLIQWRLIAPAFRPWLVGYATNLVSREGLEQLPEGSKGALCLPKSTLSLLTCITELQTSRIACEFQDLGRQTRTNLKKPQWSKRLKLLGSTPSRGEVLVDSKFRRPMIQRDS